MTGLLITETDLGDIPQLDLRTTRLLEHLNRYGSQEGKGLLPRLADTSYAEASRPQDLRDSSNTVVREPVQPLGIDGVRVEYLEDDLLAKVDHGTFPGRGCEQIG